MIFIDSNVPMYLVGADHPNKPLARQRLERLILNRERLVTSAEVFQEILHRYVSIDRPDAIQHAWAALDGIVDHVFGIDSEDVKQARDLIIENAGISARDALHVSVMRRNEVDQILSFDRGFDHIAGIVRIE